MSVFGCSVCALPTKFRLFLGGIMTPGVSVGFGLVGLGWVWISLCRLPVHRYFCWGGLCRGIMTILALYGSNNAYVCDVQ